MNTLIERKDGVSSVFDFSSDQCRAVGGSLVNFAEPPPAVLNSWSMPRLEHHFGQCLDSGHATRGACRPSSRAPYYRSLQQPGDDGTTTLLVDAPARTTTSATGILGQLLSVVTSRMLSINTLVSILHCSISQKLILES
jgi:hypothetical protein